MLRKINKQKLLRRISYSILIFFVAVSVLAPLISNERPLYLKYKGCHFFPAFSFSKKYIIEGEELQLDIAEWKHLDAEKIIFAPVAYSPGKKDLINSDFKKPSGEQLYKNKDGSVVKIPLCFRHWLGTNKMGEDVLAGLIHGTRISLLVGVLSMLFAGFLGLLLGSIAGYFSDNKLKTKRGMLYTFIFGLVVAWFYAFHVRSYILLDSLQQGTFSFIMQFILSLLILIVVCFVFYLLGKIIGRISFFRKGVFIKADSIISRLIEILISLPRIIIIVTIAAIAKPSLLNLAVIIGITSWTGIARLVRAEMLRVRELDYITACRSLGFKNFRIIFRHALPNAIAPALVAIAFGIASAILIESSLSFLSIGVPPEIVSWGTMLAQGKEYFNAWWLVIFPGIAIFLLVLAFNLLGDGIRDMLDRKTFQS
ncbi:MAG: ABC transporter permease [Bacteroidota bacterium]